MTVARFFLIILIYCAATVAWLVLGGTIEYRTAKLESSLSKEVGALWGPSELTQEAPGQSHAGQPSSGTEPEQSDIRVAFTHHHRYKGLLWFSTYTVDFSGTYTVTAGKDHGRRPFVFMLPEGAPFFENLRLKLDGQDRPADGAASSLSVEVPDDGRPHTVVVEYRTRGRDRWLYGASADRAGSARLKAFTLTATTNFADIDYPKGSVSPSQPAEALDGGRRAVWHFDDYLTRQRVGIEMPSRQNAGPIAARMAFFAPVSLLFFYTVIFTVVVLKKIPLHPMHYLFVSAGFFAFHVLMAYLVDKVNVHAAFWICAGVSTFLVVTYMRLVTGIRFAVVYVGVAQLVYLVGFSYAFFWEGNTGLTVTIGAIVTLFVLMQATGRVKWDEVFGHPAPAWAATSGPGGPPSAGS